MIHLWGSDLPGLLNSLLLASSVCGSRLTSRKTQALPYLLHTSSRRKGSTRTYILNNEIPHRLRPNISNQTFLVFCGSYHFWFPFLCLSPLFKYIIPSNSYIDVCQRIYRLCLGVSLDFVISNCFIVFVVRRRKW